MASQLTLGAWLRESRQIRGLTLTGLATAAHASNQSNLSKCERGTVIPEPTTMAKLAPYYGSPWFTDAQNVLFVKATAWILAGRPAYRPESPEEITMASYVEFALQHAALVTTDWPEEPENAQRVVRGYATRFPNVPGLAQVPWPETRPFWVWLWLQHSLNVSTGRRRLEEHVKPTVDWNDHDARSAFHAMEYHFNQEQRLLQGWERWDVVRAAAASVLGTLGPTASPWYDYPILDDPDALPDISEYISADRVPLNLEEAPERWSGYAGLVRLLQAEGVLQQDPAADGTQNYDAWVHTFAALVQQNRHSPALRKVVETLLEYPPEAIAALADLLTHIRAQSALSETLSSLATFAACMNPPDDSPPVDFLDGLPDDLPF